MGFLTVNCILILNLAGHIGMIYGNLSKKPEHR